MPSRNQGFVITYQAYNTSTGAYVTGDAANHTLRLVKDGTEAAPTNGNSEVDATNMPGFYAVALTSAETNFNAVTIGGKSATANVILVPLTVGFENLPVPLTNTSQAQFGVNVVTWLGGTPAPLAGSGNNLVQTTVSGGAQSNVNVVQWNGVGVAGTVPPDAVFIQSASLQSGSSSTTVTLVSGSAGTNDFYKGELFFLRSGLGSGESAIITTYNAATKVATLSPPLAVNPSGGDNYTIQALAAVSTIQQSNVVQVNGAAAATSSAQLGVNVVTINGAATVTSSAMLGVNVNTWNGSPVLVPTVTGVPKVDIADIAGAAVNTAAAQLGVNTVNIAGQAAALDANNLLKVDAEDVRGIVAATSLALGNVNVVSFNGTSTATSLALGNVNVVSIGGIVAATSLAGGNVNVVSFNGTLAATSLALGNTNVVSWAGGGVPTPNVVGEPLVDVNHWRGTQPNVLISNRVDSSVGALASGVIVNTSFGTGALTTTCFATSFLTGALIDITGGNAIADDLLDRASGIETGVTPRQAWRYIAAAEAGVTAGALTTSFTIAAIGNNGTNRITATTTASGNRTAVTLA